MKISSCLFYSQAQLAFGLLLLCFQGFSFPLCAQTPAFAWADSFGGTNLDAGRGIACDADGNVFLSGGFGSPGIICSHTNLTSRGGDDIFLAKYDRSGNLLWIQQAGGTNAHGAGTSGDVAYSAATDASGNVYIAGYFLGTATFAGSTLSSQGGNDIYVAKYDHSGSLLWARRAGGPYHDTALKIAVDAAGYCYVSGFFRGTADFGATNLVDPSPLYSDIYLAKYDPNGNVIWAKQAGGDNNDVSYCPAIDRDGNVFLTGYYRNTGYFETASISGTKSNSVFLAKYNAAGALQWVRSAVGATSNDQGMGRSVASDATGNVYLAGSFEGTMLFGPTNLAATGGTDLFLAKYDLAGALLWATRAGGTGPDLASCVITDEEGCAYVSGLFAGHITFGAYNLASGGTDSDIFIAKYNPEGKVIWAISCGSSGEDSGANIAMDATRTLFLSGSLASDLRVGNLTLTNRGSTDSFIARLDELPDMNVWRGTGSVVITWPTNAAGFVLQSSMNLSFPSGWMPLTNSPARLGSNFAITTPATGNAFYRLRKP